MHSSPLVSIVMPVFNDEIWISEALESCLRQTLNAVEVICVDDASTDATASIIEQYQQRESRVKLIRQETNQAAFQARRVGIQAAEAPYVLFLDGDDELEHTAAETALAQAQESEADVVGFGVSVIGPRGNAIGGYQKRLRPPQKEIEGEEILRTFFPVGKPAQGQLWRYLFSTELLRGAYSLLQEDLVLVRVNDLPITFLAMATAQKYSYVPEKLYRYYFRRGGSGHNVTELSEFEFYSRGIDSVEQMAPAVRALARRSPDPEPLLDGYETARLSIIGNVLTYLLNSTSEDHYADYFSYLHNKVSETEVVLAAADYAPEVLDMLAKHGPRIKLADRKVKSVLLTTKSLTTGGVSLVLLAQARYLSEAGYQVTIAAQRRGSILDDLPEGVRFVEITGRKLSTRLAQWAEVCTLHEVDVVIDHQILYSRNWHTYALMARAVGVPTIGWVHNFALRPVYDLKNMITFIQERANSLATLVTLSPLDVSFWKLRGIRHTEFLPNPPSPMLLEAAASEVDKTAPHEPIELIWWGRLEEHTKQVRQLLSVAGQLRRMGVDFRMRIIGPDWPGLTAEQLSEEAEKRRLGEHVDVAGPLRGQALLDAIDSADLFVSTSIIEGYQLTLAEAQVRGLPVAMYELPWLTVVQGNEGIITAPQGDAEALAKQIRDVAADPARYKALSKASVQAAKRALDLDFSQLYQQLITGTLPTEFSPEPTLEDAQQIIDWSVFFTERHAGIRTEVAEAQKAAKTARSSARKEKARADSLNRQRRAAKSRAASFKRELAATQQGLAETEQKLTRAEKRMKRMTSAQKKMQPTPQSNGVRAKTASARTAPPSKEKEETLLVKALSPTLRRVYKVAPGIRPYARKVRRTLHL